MKNKYAIKHNINQISAKVQNRIQPTFNDSARPGKALLAFIEP